jgi:hypothetical protein
MVYDQMHWSLIKYNTRIQVMYDILIEIQIVFMRVYYRIMWHNNFNCNLYIFWHGPSFSNLVKKRWTFMYIYISYKTLVLVHNITIIQKKILLWWKKQFDNRFEISFSMTTMQTAKQHSNIHIACSS